MTGAGVGGTQTKWFSAFEKVLKLFTMSISTVDSGPLHVKPEVDLNLNTEANRVLFVLNEVIQRAKLVGLLTELVDNEGHKLKQFLEPTTVHTILQTCEKYKYPTVNPSAVTSIIFQDDVSTDRFSEASQEISEFSHKDLTSGASSGPIVIKQKLRILNDSDLNRALYLLEEDPKIQNFLKEESNVSPSVKYFIKCMTEFRQLMQVRLTENAKQFKTREKYMRETFEKNERAKKEIAKLEEELVVTKTDANVCLIGKNILIKRHQNKIERIKEASHEAIENRVKQSEKAMVNDWKNSVQEQERLKLSYQQTSEKYSSMLKDHLSVEKMLRAKRAKVENQVLGWIQKFDQDIGEKQAEEEEIQALLDKQNNEVNEIQKKLDEQEEEYDELMQEKAEYEEEMLERRLYHFIMYRSARRIQRSYRMYKARKLAKKLAKKGKKEKKGKKKAD